MSAEIDKLHKTLTDLEKDRAAIDKKVASLRYALSLLEAPAAKLTLSDDLGLSKSILQTLDSTAEFFTATDLAKRMVELGYKPSGDNFISAISVTLKRMAKDGKITESESHGRAVFQTKTPPEDWI